MDFSVLFARHFARLVWLIRNQPDLVDDQKGALRAIVTTIKGGAVVLRTDGGRLVANGTPLPDILSGVHEVAGALGGNAPFALSFSAAAAPGDVLALARLLATELPAVLPERLAGLTLATVSAARVEETDAAPARSRATAQLSAELLAEIEAEQAREQAAVAAVAAEQARLAEAAASGLTGNESLDDVLVQAALTRDAKDLDALLDEAANRIEAAARSGDVELAVRGTAVLVSREHDATDNDARRVYFVALRRLFRATILRVMTPLFLKGGEIGPLVERIVRRAGEDGAVALFDEMERAPTMVERTALMTLLRSLDSAVPALVKLMGDARWHVARAAADIMGELRLADSDRALAELLRYPDERVRRTAVSAMTRFDTPFVVDALYRALSDTSAQVRLQAVYGLSARKSDPKASTAVVNAVAEEADIEVQLAMVQALGRFATPEAVNQLARAAEPDGRLFRRKSPAYRVAAVMALAEARTPGAMGTLEELLNDRDREVREAAERVLSVTSRTAAANAR
jgi:HEAT repeat protein